MNIDCTRFFVAYVLVTNLVACQPTSDKKQNSYSAPPETAIPVVVSRVQNAQEVGKRNFTRLFPAL